MADEQTTQTETTQGTEQTTQTGPTKEDLDKVMGALAKEREAHKKAAAELAALRSKADEERAKAEEAARKAGDVTVLEKSWQEKLAAQEKEISERFSGELAWRDGFIRTALVDTTAEKLASELSIAPVPFAALVKQRLRVEVVEGKPTVRVLDKAGQPSAATIEDLKRELMGDPDLAPILKASSGSGAGTSASARGSGGAPTMTREVFERLSPKQQHEAMARGVTLRG